MAGIIFNPGIWGVGPYVISFNTRTGVVTLLSSDIITALGYTPANAAASVASFNTRTGAVTLLSADVISALGFTPANAAAVVTSFNTRTGSVTLLSADVINATTRTGTGTTFVMSASPTFTGTVVATAINASGTVTANAFNTTGVLNTLTNANGTTIQFVRTGAIPALGNSAGAIAWNPSAGGSGAISMAAVYDGTGLLDFVVSQYTGVAVQESLRIKANGTIVIVNPVTAISGYSLLVRDDTTGEIKKISASSSGVTSFNTRTGAVTLLSADVIAALGYTPVNKSGDTMTGALSVPNIIPTSATPTVVLGSGAGTGATMNSILGTNQSGQINITTGTGTIPGLLCTVTLAGGFAYPNYCLPVFSPAGGDPAEILKLTVNTTTANTFEIYAYAALLPSTIIQFNYNCSGY